MKRTAKKYSDHDASSEDTYDGPARLTTRWTKKMLTSRSCNAIRDLEDVLNGDANARFGIDAVNLPSAALRGYGASVAGPVELLMFDGSFIEMYVSSFNDAESFDLYALVCGLCTDNDIQTTPFPLKHSAYAKWTAERNAWRAKQLVPLKALDALRRRVEILEKAVKPRNVKEPWLLR